ncbi:MAG: hypothetical protein JXR53_14425 [Bacteroidales bacterium]|nr:hypothetical protein [Bacteroidales bacterium]
MRNIFVIFLAVAIGFAACKKDDSDPDPIIPNPTNTIFKFFTNGAVWNYDTYDSDGGAHFTQSISITSINAQNYATVNHNIGGYYSYNDEWYADNTKLSILCSQAGNMMLIFCDADPTSNEYWHYTWTDSTGTVKDTCRIMALNETVSVPAGSFSNCIRIRETTSEDPVFYKDLWLNLDYGIIKTEGTTAQDYPTIIYEDLQNHNIQ